MKDTFEKNYPLDQFPDDFDIKKINSAMDCTGLIPSAPQNEAELEAYEDLYPFMPTGAKDMDQDTSKKVD